MAIIDPIQNDVAAQMAARAHGEAHDVNDKRTASLHGVSRRTANRWRREGHGNPVDSFASYLLTTPDPWRLVAHVRAIALRATVENLTRDELIAKYRELRKRGIHAESVDTTLDLTPGACWLDRSAASEMDAGHDELAAAIEDRKSVV